MESPINDKTVWISSAYPYSPILFTRRQDRLEVLLKDVVLEDLVIPTTKKVKYFNHFEVEKNNDGTIILLYHLRLVRFPVIQSSVKAVLKYLVF